MNRKELLDKIGEGKIDIDVRRKAYDEIIKLEFIKQIIEENTDKDAIIRAIKYMVSE